MFGFRRSRRGRDSFAYRSRRHKRRTRAASKREFEVVHNVELENSMFLVRTWFCVGLMVLMMLVLFVNLYYLQIISHESYQTRSNENRIRVLPVVPQRGIIYDRNKIPLADNSPVYNLMFYPSKNVDTRATIEELNRLVGLGLSQKNIDSLVRQSRTKKRFSGVEVYDLLNEEQIAKFSVNRYRFPGVQLAVSLKRYYPFADIVTHAIGYVSRINQADVDQLTSEGKIENYEGSNEIGKLGVERYYEDTLHGITGSREVEVNSHGQVVRTLRYFPPKPGNDIVLSLDIRLQHYAQELLGSMKGAIVALEPETGEILACYSNPSYDPNLFVRGIKVNQYQRLLNDAGKPLINRATQGGYSPASTIKPILSIMGLNEHLVTPTSTFFGPPAFTLPGSTHRFRDWRPQGHGWLDLYRAIEVSADTYFYDLASRAGINTIHRYLDLFGFGRSTGIDIKEESLGVNPSVEWKKNRFKQGWHRGDTVPIGIGQGYWTTTLMQLLKAHNILANYGRVVTPHFMKRITDPTLHDEVITTYSDEEHDRSIELSDPGYWDVPRAGMYLVVNGPEGTGRRAFYGAQYKAAGKSGTAQLVSIKQDEKYDASSLRAEHRDNALFVAFAPFVHPRILCGVILENEGGGSAKGAPIIRKMLDKYLLELYPGGYMGERVGVMKRFGIGGTVLVQ